jgi:hypothetical protein
MELAEEDSWAIIDMRFVSVAWIRGVVPLTCQIRPRGINSFASWTRNSKTLHKVISAGRSHVGRCLAMHKVGTSTFWHVNVRMFCNESFHRHSGAGRSAENPRPA